jgi:hypothetical protein
MQYSIKLGATQRRLGSLALPASVCAEVAQMDDVAVGVPDPGEAQAIAYVCIALQLHAGYVVVHERRALGLQIRDNLGKPFAQWPRDGGCLVGARKLGFLDHQHRAACQIALHGRHGWPDRPKSEDGFVEWSRAAQISHGQCGWRVNITQHLGLPSKMALFHTAIAKTL